MNKMIFGMVHLLPLPGTAKFEGGMKIVYERALADAEALIKGGVNGVIVENDGDQPYFTKLELEQTAALSAVASAIKQKYPEVSMGISAAFNDYESGLAIAKAVGADFVRLPVFSDTVVTFTGIIQPCCSAALRYRKKIMAEDVKIFADVQVKYTEMLLKDISIEKSALVAQSSGADAIIVTGEATGLETPIDVVKRVKTVVHLPVYVGSGTTVENAGAQLGIADGAIVGTHFKTDGKVDSDKVKKFMSEVK